MTHAIARKRTAQLCGAALLAAGLSTFLLYEAGPGRAGPVQVTVAAAAR